MSEHPVDTSHPFTRAAALQAGLGKALRTRAFKTVLRGAYVAADVPLTPAIRAQAALLGFHPTARASHATAGRVWGLPLPPLPDEHVSVTDPRHRHRRAGVVCHLGAGETAADLPVSSPRQTFVELATQLDLVDLVVAGDHLVRQELVGLDQLRDFCHAARGPGAVRAREAAALVRAQVDSPMETRTRLLLVLAGLPEPRVNALVGDGLSFRKYDLSYPRSRTIIEYDGRHHVERIEQWESDVSRREGIDDDEWRIIVLLAKDVYRTPGVTVERIHRVLLARREPGVPAVLSDAWRRHFPGQTAA